MRFLHKAIEWTPASFAFVGCALALWFWSQARKSESVPRWRRVSATAGLFLLSLSIVFGAFAWIYWTQSTDPSPGPPEPTYITAYAGFYIVVLSVPFLLCAKGRTRAMLLSSSAGLFGFYFLMFLSP